LTSRLPHLIAFCLLPGLVAAQGVPTDDSGLTARDIVQTGDREADLALQADKLAVRELIAEIEREQLATLQRILDAQTSFGGQGLPAMVSGLEGGSGDPDRSVEAVYGTGEIDPNPGGAQMFGDAAENVEELIIRVAQETSGFAGVTRARLSPVQWRALLQALIWQESRFTIDARSPVGAYGLTQIMPGTASDLGINPEYFSSPYLQVHGGARYLAAQLDTFDGNIIFALAAYNAGPGRVFEYGGVPPFRETQHYVQVIPERYNLYRNDRPSRSHQCQSLAHRSWGGLLRQQLAGRDPPGRAAHRRYRRADFRDGRRAGEHRAQHLCPRGTRAPRRRPHPASGGPYPRALRRRTGPGQRPHGGSQFHGLHDQGD
jgi:hypothetical protein